MEGLEISILNLREVLIDNSEFRTDSEFFRKKYLEADIFLKTKKSEKISKYAKVSDGDHDKFPDNQIDEVRYLQAKDIKNHLIIDENPVFISNKYFIKNKRSHIFEENVILSIMGSVGDIAITPKGFTPSLANRAIAIIKDIKDVNAYYLFAYLSSKFGQLQIDRQKNGGVQERINLDVLSKVKIPNVRNEFQLFIEKTVKQSHLNDKLSKHAYSSAEILLLETLSLKDFEPSTDRVNVKSYKESFLTSGRLDSEFYQKKYEDIESKILGYKNGADILKNQIEYITTGEYASSYESVGLESVPYIRNNNMKKGHIELDDEYYVNPNNFKTKANIGEILTSRVGTIGLFGVIKAGQENCVYSDNILCFKLKSNYIPEVYAMLFSTVLYKLLLEKLAGGSVQSLITQTSIKELPIPNIEYSIQLKVADLINESFSLKKQSEQLLETAKRAVEIAIELDEEAAMRYIEEVTN